MKSLLETVHQILKNDYDPNLLVDTINEGISDYLTKNLDKYLSQNLPIFHVSEINNEKIIVENIKTGEKEQINLNLSQNKKRINEVVSLKNTSVFSNLSDEEKRLLASLINTFGTGQHPVADSSSLGGFAFSYIKKLLNKPEVQKKLKTGLKPNFLTVAKTLQKKINDVKEKPEPKHEGDINQEDLIFFKQLLNQRQDKISVDEYGRLSFPFLNKMVIRVTLEGGSPQDIDGAMFDLFSEKDKYLMELGYSDDESFLKDIVKVINKKRPNLKLAVW